MDKRSTEGVGIFAQHYPRVAAIITSRDKDKTNAMTVAWHTPVSYDPPLFAIAIAPKRYSYQLISSSKEFAVNFMPAARAEEVAAVGGSGGGDMDKLRSFRLSSDRPAKTLVPILHAAYAAYECRLVEDRPCGDHRLLIGEIVAVHWQKNAFMEDGSPDLARINPLLYIGNEHYVSTEGCTIRTIERELCIGRLRA
ncbi:MAG: flavin reductase family protein [Dehalococcoidia bacterium]|nr:flavin reductase family protein [Dehalococcoidia bacterium]